MFVNGEMIDWQSKVGWQILRGRKIFRTGPEIHRRQARNQTTHAFLLCINLCNKYSEIFVLTVLFKQPLGNRNLFAFRAQPQST